LELGWNMTSFDPYDVLEVILMLILVLNLTRLRDT
jgi:hypothetical protein